jgi:hypothetical protein
VSGELPFEEVERKDSDFSSNRIPSPRRNRQSKTKVELSQQFFMEISIAKNLTFNLARVHQYCWKSKVQYTAAKLLIFVLLYLHFLRAE